jgi:hypothetical protein
MGRARREKWHLLTAVVLLAVARPGLAQLPLPPLPGPGGALATSPKEEQRSSRLTEIRVELAWLADPLVCPYYPCVRVVGGTLEVGGLVPDASVRVRALQVARQNAPLPVVDRLKVYAGLLVPRVHVPAAKLQAAALVTVQAEFPAIGPDLKVTCSPAGLLTVSGIIDSAEHKLQVSQRLRRLPGCAAVVNLLQTDVAEPTRSQPLAALPVPVPGPAAPLPPVREMKSEATPTPTSAELAVETQAPPAAAPLGPAVPLPAMPLPTPQASLKHNPAPAPPPVILGPSLQPNLDVPEAPAMKLNESWRPAPPPPPSPGAARQVAKSAPPLLLPAPEPSDTANALPQAAAQQSVSARPALPLPPPEPVAAPDQPAAPAPAEPAPMPPSPPPAPAPAVSAPPVSAPSEPATVAKASAAPYVTEGAVILSPPEPEPSAHQQLTPAQMQAQLRQRIKEACPDAREVTVTFTSGLGLLVRVQLEKSADRDEVAARVRSLPELASFLTDVEVVAAP